MKTLIYEIIGAAGTIEAEGARILKPFGLTPMTYNILGLLRDGPLSQREIGERVIVAASSVTFQMRALQKKGLVRRARADARTWKVSLTARGVTLRRRAGKRMDYIIGQIHLDPEIVAHAESALRAVRDHLPRLSGRHIS